jgi:predicted lipid-binding transport protein (Tim44 family)
LKYRKLMAIATLSVLLGGVAGSLMADPADARAGRRGGSFGGSSSYKSMGDRGNRTFDQGKQNNMQGITQSRQTTAKPAAAAGAAQKQSWFQRNPLMAGLLGAVAGTAIGMMLMNALGGMGGLGGFMGIIGLLLLAGLAFMAFRMFRASRQPQPQFSGMAGHGNVTPFQRPDAPMAATATAPQASGGYSQTKEQGLAAMALNNPGFRTEKAIDDLTTIFFRVQEAWSANDKAGIQAVTTDEMADYFAQDLDLMVVKGERNVIKNIVIREFSIDEAWTEEATEYITAKIQARLVDFVERNGQVVEGDPNQPTDFAEFWTFKRPRGGNDWKLSAINQIS